MPYSTRIYDELPLYARLADEQGVLAHVCEAYQPELDAILSRLERQEFFYNPDLTPERFLDWLGQFVGLAPIGEHWLGLGLNPDWPAQQKRTVIARAWRYWQLKGTEWGVREALALWLQWEESHSRDRLAINLPFGKSPTAHPPKWWDYVTTYDAWLTQTWEERQQFGSGDYPQTYKPDWFSLESSDWFWEYGKVWTDRTLDQVNANPIDSPGSALGPDRPWMHLHPEVQDWNRLFPDVLDLNLEIWSAQTQPTTFGWLDFEETSPVLLQRNANLPQQQTVREFEILGFQYDDLLPFSALDVQPEPFSIAEEQVEFGIWGELGWGDTYEDGWWYTAPRLITIQTITTESPTANLYVQASPLQGAAELELALETVSSVIEAPAIGGTSAIELQTAELVIEASAIGGQVGDLEEELLTADQPAEARSLGGTDSLALSTADQAAEARSLGGTDSLALSTADQAAEARSLSGTDSLALSTADQAVNTSSFNARIYDWFFSTACL
ncbi:MULTISPECIES: phage tail protein [Trichocoleus]|uniref:Phage tail protein n=1 Tax=Trichocoleus desertorum GB2-A4 TaxID=2933944 RepID=A0ABV0JCM9_9CYAN|nr:phage tail protein [Trichocoleus sp. FACHB-46]MBD1864172.1 hypothetical protein [Trichocoleus sp. FACHB-46]